MNMKRKLNNYMTAIMGLFLLTSCHNDDVPVIDTHTCQVNVEVSLDNFFSCYDFTDTKHSVENAVNSREFTSSMHYDSLNPLERYKSFNSYYSSNSFKIEARVLFYKDDLLVDSIHAFTDNTEPIKQRIELAAGKYTVIATLSFFRSSAAYWTLKDRENLKTAYLQSLYSKDLWSIMSYTYKEVTLGSSKESVLEMTPRPVGALCYAYCQNFQNSVSDYVAIETDHYANGYKLDPRETNKFIYNEEGGILFEKKPSHFQEKTVWQTFQRDFFDFFYILAPQCDVSFFSSSDDAMEYIPLPSYAIENGTVYMAYWDYDHKANPYFGKADNSHWY